jgi:Transposase DDE domain
VYVHDGTGTHRDEYFFTTDLHLRPKQIVECYTQRWSIETTFQECRAYLKLESPKGYGQQTVLRFTPCLFGLYTIIVLLYLQLPASLNSASVLSWHGKSAVTFSDMLVCVRRAIWQQWFFQTPLTTRAFSKLPRLLQETSLYALAPAAEMAHTARQHERLICQLHASQKGKSRAKWCLRQVYAAFGTTAIPACRRDR